MIQELINFVAVLAVAITIAGSIGALYASGLRLWAAAEEKLETQHHASITCRTGSAVCFALCVCIVLFALWLMIPVFH